MRKARYTKDIQKQVQLPTSRFSISRRTSAQSISMSRMRKGILPTWQNEESYENRTRLFHAQGLRCTFWIFSPALAGVPKKSEARGPYPTRLRFENSDNSHEFIVLRFIRSKYEHIARQEILNNKHFIRETKKKTIRQQYRNYDKSFASIFFFSLAFRIPMVRYIFFSSSSSAKFLDGLWSTRDRTEFIRENSQTIHVRTGIL